MKKAHAAFVLGFASICLAAAALAQTTRSTPNSYVGELVVSPSGQVVSPWKEIRSCDNAGKCFTVIGNPKTREIARYQDHWSSKFEATGNGKEIRRVEPAIDKAIRLSKGSAH